ncbi:wax synthase family protein [Planctomicrobium sp. SH668]|uniref:wax synthase family protein n=1 Tax=Planctomicrobium sp. SH668 TaxID=3448126 RepID=UPI003F5C5E32
MPDKLPNNPVSAWAVMVLLVALMYFALKFLTWRNCKWKGPPVWKQAAYLFAWPGMDADKFLDPHPMPINPPSSIEYCFAFGKWILGIWLLVIATTSNLHWYLTGCLEMIGLLFFFHFGLFHLLSCFWRRIGLNAKPIMNAPILAQGVGEFWGTRWNLAFRDLTYTYLFKPLNRIYSPSTALLVGFLISGLIHEIVISVPARSGYGLPTLYFLIQGAGILIAKTSAGRYWKLSQGFSGRLCCFCIVAVPSALLFHPPFLKNVIVPFFSAIKEI